MSFNNQSDNVVRLWIDFSLYSAGPCMYTKKVARTVKKKTERKKNVNVLKTSQSSSTTSGTGTEKSVHSPPIGNSPTIVGS